MTSPRALAALRRRRQRWRRRGRDDEDAGRCHSRVGVKRRNDAVARRRRLDARQVDAMTLRHTSW